MNQRPPAPRLFAATVLTVLGVVACQDAESPIAPSADERMTPLVQALAAAPAAKDTIFNRGFDRVSGAPRPDTASYAVDLVEAYAEAHLIVRPVEGRPFPASAIVRIDGEEIFTPNDFNRSAGPLVATVPLHHSGAISAEIRSQRSEMQVLLVGSLRPGYQRVGSQGGVAISDDGRLTVSIGEGLPNGALVSVLSAQDSVLDLHDEALSPPYAVHVVEPGEAAGQSGIAMAALTTPTPLIAIADFAFVGVTSSASAVIASRILGQTIPSAPRLVPDNIPSVLGSLPIGAALGIELVQVAVAGTQCLSGDSDLYRLDAVGPLDPEATPVVLVHGWQPDRPDCATWRGLLHDHDPFDPAETWAAFEAQLAETPLPTGQKIQLYRYTYPTYNEVGLASVDLVERLDALPGPTPAIMVGHSMGGLVARGASDLGGSQRIAKIITLGTPHEGSPLAMDVHPLRTLTRSWVVAALAESQGGGVWFGALVDVLLALATDGFRDLSEHVPGAFVDLLRQVPPATDLVMFAGTEVVPNGLLEEVLDRAMAIVMSNTTPSVPAEPHDLIVPKASALAQGTVSGNLVRESEAGIGVAHLGMARNANAITWAIGQILASLPEAPSYEGIDILFTSETDGSGDIWGVGVDGQGRVNLSSVSHDPMGVYNEAAGKWSPDGSTILFFSDKGAAFRKVYLMDADGTNARPLTPNEVTENDPFWGSDGTKVYYNRNVRYPSTSGAGCGPCPFWELYVYDLTTGRETRLTNNGSRDEQPVASPDGASIAFSRAERANDCCNPVNVWLMDADGQNQRQMSPTNGLYESPADWDSTSNLILANYRTGRDIVLLDPTTGQTSVVSAGTSPQGGVAFSPDGQTILVSRGGDIYFLDVSTGDSFPFLVGPQAEWPSDWRTSPGSRNWSATGVAAALTQMRKASTVEQGVPDWVVLTGSCEVGR